MDDKLSDLLKSPDVTVEDLLLEDNTVQEIRNGNQKVIEFLLKKKNMKDLLSYILEEPPADASHNRGHKFPFMVSEIFGNSMSKLFGIFFSDEPEEDPSNAKNDEDEGDEETTEEEGDKESPTSEDVDKIKSLLKIKQAIMKEQEQEKPTEKEPEDKKNLEEKAPETTDEQAENTQEADTDKKDEPEDHKEESEDHKEESEDHKEEPEEQQEKAEKKKQLKKRNLKKQNNLLILKNQLKRNSLLNLQLILRKKKEDVPDSEEVKEKQEEDSVSKSDEKVEETESPKEAEEPEKNEAPEEEEQKEAEEPDNTSEPTISNDEKVIETSEESNQEKVPEDSTKNDQTPSEEKEEPSEVTKEQTDEKEETTDEKEEAAEEKEEEDKPEASQEEEKEEAVSPAPTEQIEEDPELKKPITEYLVDFIRTDEELNPVLCGYFCKLLNTIITQNKEKFFLYAFDPANSMIEHFTKHVYNRSIADLFIRIIKDCNEDASTKLEILSGIIDGIESQQYEGKLNSAHIIKELMEIKNILEVLKEKEINVKLFDLLKSDDEMTVQVVLDILNTLYKKFPFYVPKKSNDAEEDEFAKNYLSSSDTDEMVIIPYIDKLLIEKLPLVEEILERETDSVLEQQYGETIKPFGAVRMGITRFIANIIAVGSQDYALKLSLCLPYLLKYCVEYPWNTMLHNLVEQIFEEIFKANSKYKDDIRTALLVETSVTDFITDCAIETEMKGSGRNIRTGLIATVINIANILNNHKSEYVQEELKKNEKWTTFVDTELKYSNENNERALAGHQSKTGDSDDDSANYQTSMDKLFAAFTSLKESHDSSRELSDSDEEEEDQNTDNILEGIDSSEDKKDQNEKEQTKEKASEEPENTESKIPKNQMISKKLGNQRTLKRLRSLRKPKRLKMLRTLKILKGLSISTSLRKFKIPQRLRTLKIFKFLMIPSLL
ncbi:unnamed protein product [Moneuplotes crassus]|uniref:Uncharacterized protein n=2 Tax=Euplotes crassus TaxID=5936 RepID=A0AAD2D0A4_EUPCR|nr:unnamed protein product [Moneuplotes crassus]